MNVRKSAIILLGKKKSDIAAFVVAPYGTRQDTLFFSDGDLVPYDREIVSLCYKGLENVAICKPMINFCHFGFNTAAIHYYPIDYKESISNRGGMSLVVGFVYPRKFQKKPGLTNSLMIFFDEIRAIATENMQGMDVATGFINVINQHKKTFL